MNFSHFLNNIGIELCSSVSEWVSECQSVGRSVRRSDGRSAGRPASQPASQSVSPETICFSNLPDCARKLLLHWRRTALTWRGVWWESRTARWLSSYTGRTELPLVSKRCSVGGTAGTYCFRNHSRETSSQLRTELRWIQQLVVKRFLKLRWILLENGCE